MKVTNKAINEIELAIKEGTPDSLGRALLRSYTLGRIEAKQDPHKRLIAPLVSTIYETAQNNFGNDTEKRVQFSRYVHIEDWFLAHKYLGFAQDGATQRDAVLLQSYADKFYLTESILSGDYTEDTKDKIFLYSLTNLLKADPFTNTEELQEAEEITDRLYYSTAWLIAFNTICELIGEVFDIPEFEELQLNIKNSKELLDLSTEKFKMTATLILENERYSDEDKFSRIDALKKFTSFMDNNGMSKKPSAAAISKARSFIEDFSAFKNSSDIFSILSPTIAETIKLEKE